MAGWVGQSWQVLDGDTEQVMIGVTFGAGLCDEAVEAAGALSIALAALREELARPVELPAGGASRPEAIAELDTDTSTLIVRGSREAVAAAWGRLPSLFTADIVSDDAVPLRAEQPFWPADLVRRTGRNAAALAWLQDAVAPNAHELARALVPRLNPLVGQTRAVFFTTDESLVGAGFPASPAASRSSSRTHWADGTLLRSDHAFEGEEGGARVELAAGSSSQSAPGANPVLFSALVPRSAAGVAAAHVLHRQLAATAANLSGDPLTVHAGTAGLGADYCEFFLCSPAAGDGSREELLEKVSRTLAQVPDPWIEDALAKVQGSLPAIERERSLAGLRPEPGASTAEVLQVAASVGRSLQLAIDLPPIETEDGRDADPDVSVSGPSLRSLGRRQRFVTWASGRFAGTSVTGVNTLVVGEAAILVGLKPSGLPGSPTHWRGWVDTTRVLAVLEDQAGAITVVDDQLRMVSFHPLLFRRSARLVRLLDEKLAGAPRLSCRSGVDRTTVERWARQAKRTFAVLYAVAAAFAVFVIVMIFVQNAAGPAVKERLTVSDTAELKNGSRITASAFEIVPPNPDDPEYRVTVKVNFCAGGNTSADGLPPEAQRSVAPGDFSLFGEDYSTARLVSSNGELRAETLQRGQCTAGDLVYKGQQLENPRLSYKNPVGDDVIWYRYGQVPRQ